jgi:AraC-like DNA-binding protein
MERAKEMIIFEDLTLSEIAKKLHYSNLSHFSAQFKKHSGLPPSAFKKLKEKRRLTIQEISNKS